MFEQTSKNIEDVRGKETGALLSLTVESKPHGCFTETSKVITAENGDIFDVLAYIVFALAPQNRLERVPSQWEQLLPRRQQRTVIS